MFKKVSLFTFILLFTFVSAAFAHTGLKSSTPQNGEVINEELKQITLTFEGKIEQGSTFTVQNANGESIAVNNITITENVLSGDLSSPLENGEYTVDWSIIGADGHLIEDSFAFTVDVPIAETVEEPTGTETPVEEETETEVNTQTETNVEENEVDQANPSENTEAAQNEGNSYILPIIIGALIVIIIISFVFLAKRKK